eukprot:1501784-Pyramimonas_sp.AAC.1
MAPAAPNTDRRENNTSRTLSSRLLQGESVLIGSRPRYVEATWPRDEKVPGARCKCARCHFGRLRFGIGCEYAARCQH